MRGNIIRRIVSTMCGVLLAVSATAVSVNVLSHEALAPVAMTNFDRDETVVTYSNFVVTDLHVVALDVATPIPITADSLASLDARNYSDNVAVMQNMNCERTSS